MRLVYGNCVTEIVDAIRIGTKLIFKLYNDERYSTDDYCNENAARCALDDLAKNGYIKVDALNFE